MAMRRAYAVLEIKAVNDATGIIEGIASTPTTDRMGDIVEPGGAQFTLPLPLLWQHDAKQPIGHVIAAKVTDAGIHIRAQIATNVLPQIDQAWAMIKAGLVRGLSIGFRAIEANDIQGTWGQRFVKWDWLELSAVTIPANADASIQTVKSFDIGAAASGDPAATSTRPGVSGHSGSVSVTARNHTTMTITEQIKGIEATRAAKAAELSAIQTKAIDEGRTKDASEKEKFDTLDTEIKGLDAELVDLHRMEEMNARAAKAIPASAGTNGTVAAGARDTRRVTVTRELPKGILFARYAMCVGASRGIPSEAMRLAKEHYPDDPGVVKLIEKGAVAGASTSGSHNIDDMIPYNIMADFIEYLRPGSIIGKFGGPNPGGGPNYPSLNRVGFNERVSGMSTGFTAAWRGEGLPAIPSAAVTFNTSLLYNNLAALAILTKEAIRFSNPSAEARVRDDLARAVNGKMDLDFVDPAKAASGTTSPASITYGIVATTPTGTTAAYFRTNLATMLKLFTQNNLGIDQVVLIMSASMALELSMMINTLGNEDFPNINAQGGSVRGIPVITSEHLTSVGSPSTQTIIAAKASEIYLADDGVVTVEASDQASIEMQSTSSQTAIGGTGASLVSLWQTGAIGLMATREITWKLRRSTAVQYISPAAYSA